MLYFQKLLVFTSISNYVGVHIISKEFFKIKLTLNNKILHFQSLNTIQKKI